MAPLARDHIFDDDGIVAVAIQHTPEVHEARLDGTCKEPHEAIKAVVRQYKAVELWTVMPAM
jgi:hypothetical protein